MALTAGSFGPSLAALAVLVRTDGWPAIRREAARLVRLRHAAGATLVAAGLPIGLAAVALLVDQALGGSTSVDWPSWWAVTVIAGYVLIAGGPLGEELGWRGYLLPHLERDLGPLSATLVTAAVWAVWHLPLFLIAGTVQTLVPLWMFAVQIGVTSFVYTWLVHLTPHSLAPALAFHTSFNVTVGLLLLPSADASATRSLLLALLAATFLAVALARTTTFRDGDSEHRPQATSTTTVQP